ncbi:MAG: dihydroorotate dehydrogenase (quinone), partial [Ferruginibacter sp.]|nr:dihydroorotate dehydrogenase (quinone) [Ferruginibacter sp.]
MYNLLRSFLFMFDAEKVHHFSMNSLRILCSFPFIKKIIQKRFIPANELPKNVLGLEFKNSVGLAAGFDKNAKYLNEMEALGFGCVEIGTVTPLPQDGNPTPRSFRLPKDKALINRMGFNNDGVEAVAERLNKWQLAVSSWQLAKEQQLAIGKKLANCKLPTVNYRLIIGGNIGKNKITANENAWKDY